MLFGWDGLLGGHSSVGWLAICKKNAHHTRARDEGEHKKRVEGKNGQPRVFIGLWNTSSFTMAKDPFAATKPYYATTKRASLLRTRWLASRLFYLRIAVASFVVADQKAEIVLLLLLLFFCPPQWRSGLHHGGLESMGNCVFALCI